MKNPTYKILNHKTAIISVLLMLFLNTAFAQTIVYVKWNATGSPANGTSWNQAYRDLNQALTAHANTSGGVQIWVSSGTYYPTTTTSRNISFQIGRANLTVAGGFVGTETSFSQRNPILNPTTLSGNIGSTTTNTDNSFKVVWVNNAAVNTSTHLMGLQINGGYTTTFGGGLFVSEGEISMTDCMFYNNTAQFGGGAFFLGPGLAVMDQNIVSRCIFRDNYASIYGGGVSLGGSRVKFTSCLFYNNEGVQGGGGLHVGNSITDIFNCTFTKNTTSTLTGTQYARGSAIYFEGTLSNYAIHKLTNSIIVGNTPYNNLQIARPTNWGTYTHNLFEGTGYGTNVLTFNPALPLFADVATNDYRIDKFCSQAYNVGTTFTGFQNELDITGGPRKSSANIDLGSYEYDSNSSVTGFITCAGLSTGQIVIPNGGSGSLYYLVQNTTSGWGSGSSARTFSNLASGTYYSAIQQSGCSSIVPLDDTMIADAPVLSFSGIVKQITCNGAANAEVRITSILGGFGAGQRGVRVNGGSNYFVPNTVTGIGVGVTTVTVSQLNTCFKHYFYTITQPGAISTVLTNWVDVACNGQNNGKVSFIPSGGALPYSFSVSGISASAYTIPGGNLEIGGLSIGTKRLTTRDANGCTVNSTNFDIAQPLPLISSVLNRRHISCNNLTDGMLVMTATGGTLNSSNYLFTVINNPSISRNLNSLLGISAGTYSVRVTDFNNCGHTLTGVTITTPSTLVASRLVTNNLCSGLNQGAITVSGTGGTPPFQYQMDVAAYQPNRAFNGLFQGNYILRVKDANNCEAVTSANLSDPLPFGIAEQKIAPTCNGNTDGKLLITLTGGIGTKSTTVNGIGYSGNFTATGLTALQLYQLTIQDQNGCVDYYNTLIPDKEAITLTGAVTKATCEPTTSDWILTLDANGGNGGFSYKIDNGVYTTNNVFGSLALSTIIGFAQDSKMCVSTITSIIAPSANPLAATLSTKTDVLCFGNATGAISVNVSGGNSPYLYRVNNGIFTDASVLSNLSSGNKDLQIKDQSNCLVTLSGIVINQPATELSASAAIENISSIKITASGGTGAYAYILNSGSSQASNQFSNLTSGLYTIKITDANGCFKTIEQNVIVPATLTGISNSFSDNNIEIYPNPSAGDVNFKSKNTGILYIYDLNGSLVSEIAIQKETYNLSLSKNGLYLLRFVSNESVSNHKLIINK